MNPEREHKDRKRPASGVLINPTGPTIVYLTVCTKDRAPCLANADTHAALVDAWRQAHAWLVGRYVMMPDHVHLFAGYLDSTVPLGNWVRYWKSLCTKSLGERAPKWQAGFWDRRIRSVESYDEKWAYVRGNPVRHGLVGSVDEWPYQGELNVLPW